MNPEQTERLFSTLGRIEQKIDSHLEDDAAVHRRHENELNNLDLRVGDNEKAVVRAKGWTAGVGSVMAMVLAVLGIEQFWR
jgi:hypothetical protein